MEISEWIRGNGQIDPVLYAGKAEFITHLLCHYGSICCAIDQAIDKNETLEDTCKSMEVDEEFWSSLLDLIYDDEIFLLTLKLFSEIEFDPEDKDEADVIMYAGMMRRFYCHVLPDRKYADLDVEKVLRIDFSLSKLAFVVGRYAAIVTSDTLLRRDRNIDRIKKSRIGSAKSKGARKQTAIEKFFTIDRRSSLKPYSIANEIQKRWPQKGQNEKIPSRDTILSYLKEEKLIE